MTPEALAALALEISTKRVFIAQLNYKSGIQMIVALFKLELEHGDWNWEMATPCISEELKLPESIFMLQPSELESVFQIESYACASEILSEAAILENLQYLQMHTEDGDQ
jgi:hypothetical protein